MMITSYVISAGKVFLVVFPLQRYEHAKHDRLPLLQFYQSEFEQHVYSQTISVEPLIEQIKDAFDIDPLPVRGFDKARSIVLISILLYKLMI